MIDFEPLGDENELMKGCLGNMSVYAVCYRNKHKRCILYLFWGIKTKTIVSASCQVFILVIIAVK